MPDAPRIASHGLTDTGRVRTDNQDALRASPSGEEGAEPHGHLYGVADGMGGLKHGGVASTLALEILFQSFHAQAGRAPLQRLKQGVQDANIGICQAANRMGAGRMGTTLTAVHLEGHTLHVAHGGDSRAYLVRDGSATCLTQDHTRVFELVRMRLLSPDKVRTHSQRSILDRCLGADLFIQPDLFSVPVRAGDLVVLCTDGVWASLEDSDFGTFAAAHPELDAYNQALLDAALDRGSDDNLSVLSVRLEALAGAPRPEPPSTNLGALFRRVFRR